MKKIVAALVSGLLCACAHAQIQWEVENRFPFFTKEAFRSLEDAVGDNPINLETRITQLKLRDQVNHLKESAWNPETGKHDAARILSPSVRISGRTAWLDPACEWSLTNSAGQSVQKVSGPCQVGPWLEATIGEPTTLSVRKPTGEQFEQAVLVKKRLVVAIGDSFASGEGNPDYSAKFEWSPDSSLLKRPAHTWMLNPNDIRKLKIVNAQWLDTKCHRSIMAWPSLYALQQALTNKDTVVQFASFACSGAEIMDGFYLPQKNTPGTAGTKLSPSREDKFLKFSQQEALARFLCPTNPVPTDLEVSRKIAQTYLNPYYNNNENDAKKVTMWKCAAPLKPDELLVLFGGNDTKFSGIVKYVFHPAKLAYNLPVVGFLMDKAIKLALTPVPPEDAKKYLQLLPENYGYLRAGLEGFVEQGKTKVRMLQYPDPASNDLAHNEAAKELRACQLRTGDANRPIQQMIASQLPGPFKNEGAWYGISPKKLTQIREQYVDPLRKLQLSSTSEFGWELVDSLPAFHNHGICGGTLECESAGENCRNSDRVRWAYFTDIQYVRAPNSCPMKNLLVFNPYDDQQGRGLRLANDAALVAARVAPNGSLYLDWVNNMAHPTAAAHARVASLVAGKPLVPAAPEPAQPWLACAN
ncbi:SGNH/GDSL hydrolase family protein [Polaromonas naphthalenivorans]|uniref:SGNH hydrolase-type esterase domain-containing protein n=1 Tax=Polaromonas naphthalenivorans (strain CJ2) TaxID=365044 RepID=A1VWE1_POLNA|nr:hypothetical protein [Polaromonas naphthalenivorans]ABM39969.1 hypothetical protein Pnap_4905 [Polaromonas naphthalenivorans CJ2]